MLTKQSTWERPTESAVRPGDDSLPSYASGPNAPQVSDDKHPYQSNNPYGSSGTESDAALAARLQAEENARSGGHSPLPGDRGQSDQYYGAGQTGGQGGYPSQPSTYDQQLPPRPGSADKGKPRGFLGKLLGKSSSSQQYQQSNYGQQAGYGGGGGGGYPQQGGYGGYSQQQGYGGYPQQGGYYQQQPPRRSGLGAGGGAALGLGGGLLGGMLLGEAMEGGDGGGDGGDYGGGDGGGGGDMGGGDGGGGA